MALIKCSKCGKEVSDKAKSCPHCRSEKTKKNSLQKNIFKLVGLITCIILIIFYSYLLFINPLYYTEIAKNTLKVSFVLTIIILFCLFKVK